MFVATGVGQEDPVFCFCCLRGGSYISVCIVLSLALAKWVESGFYAGKQKENSEKRLFVEFVI